LTFDNPQTGIVGITGKDSSDHFAVRVHVGNEHVLALGWASGIGEKSFDGDLYEAGHNAEVLKLRLPRELGEGGLRVLDCADHVRVFAFYPENWFLSHLGLLLIADV
jgi:hypothetical protein